MNNQPEKIKEGFAGRDSKIENVDLKNFYLEKMYGDRYVQYRKMWNSADKKNTPQFPLNIDICTNDACNLDCAICPSDKTEKKKRCTHFISGNILDKIRQEAIEHSVCAFNLGGYECTRHRESFIATIEMIKKTPAMDFIIHTNGTLLTNEMIDRLFDSNLTVLSISLDAATDATYRTVRGKNFLPLLRQKLAYIAELRERRNRFFPMIQVSFCVNPLNFREKDIFQETWKDVAQLFVFQPYVYNKKANFAPGDDFETIREKFCASPFRRVTVFYDGDILPCCGSYDRRLALGNINDMSIYDAWHGKKMESVRQQIMTLNHDSNSICYNCLSNIYVPRGIK